MKGQMPGQLIEIDGLKIHYEKVGFGPNVLLLLPGGIGSTRSDFSLQLSEDKGLDRKQFTMIAWDPPGYGYSRPPARVYDKDVYKRDADCAAKLMMTLGYNYYSALGWSDGGKTALLMAIKYQSRIDKIVIWGATCYTLNHDKYVLKACRDTDKWNQVTKKYYVEAYGDEFKELWSKHVDHYVNNLDDICKNEVKNIKCPSLVMHGDLDPLPKEHFDYLCKTIPDSSGYRFPKGSHNVHQEFCEKFNEVVTDFLLE